MRTACVGFFSASATCRAEDVLALAPLRRRIIRVAAHSIGRLDRFFNTAKTTRQPFVGLDGSKVSTSPVLSLFKTVPDALILNY